MPQRFSIGSIQLNANPQQRTAVDNEPDDRAPYRILVLGDFGGAGAETSRSAKPVRVDLDNIETIFAKFPARIELQVGNERFVFEPRSLSDLHPDGLFQLRCFAPLRELRSRLANPKNFEAALADLGSLTGDAPPLRETSGPSAAPKETENEMFERLLGRPRSAAASQPATPSVQALLREAVAPHIVSTNVTDQESAISVLDRQLGTRVNTILHTPDFQTLEAAWRGLDFTVRRMELDESLQLFVLDVSRDRMCDPMGRHVVAESLASKEGDSWSLLVGNFSFGTSTDDSETLAWIASVAEQQRAPFIAAADTVLIDLLGKNELHWPAQWTALRESSSAQFISLLTPQFMLRLPYGEKSDPIESFKFEEMPAPPIAAHYLWGNPALLAACVFARSLVQSETDAASELSSLPLHAYRENSEAKMTPCTERWLNDGEVEGLQAQGISVVRTLRGADAVRLSLQSIKGIQ